MSASDAAATPQPPYPDTEHYLVKDVAAKLNGLAFGTAEWHHNLRTNDEFYRPLAQAFLNAQAGWYLDIRDRKWRTWDQLSDEQRAMR